ncbi:MAG: DNA repair protein RadA, partial [Candidatus Hydrogenedentes bacterium]|nr:DNA repair protein RadA [Candidatus Hydrogenedentota bacterium]
MGKSKTIFVCQSCGAVHMRWLGRCTECGEWNTVVEETTIEEGRHARPSIVDGAVPTPITECDGEPPERLGTGLDECDRVMGGGIVGGSLTLVGGDPGIGKSTL